MPKTVLWAWAALAAALYGALAYGSYVTLPSLAGGMLGFDMRPLGMSGAEAIAYENAMTDAGRSYYLDWLKPLDTVFILALMGLLLALSWTFKGVLGWVGALSALVYAGLDWYENWWVANLTVHRSKDTAELAGMIGNVTTGKFLSLGLAIIVLLLAWKRSAHPRPRNSE